MKKIIVLLLCSIMLFQCADIVFAADGVSYYVSNDGSDDNNGLTPETPFKTLDRLLSNEFHAGDRILLECGSVWFEEMIFDNLEGSPNNPIVISSYGTGEKPVIDGGGDVRKVGIYIKDGSNIEISGLLIRNSGVGICMEYSYAEDKRNLNFFDCDFINVTGRNKFKPLDGGDDVYGDLSRSSGVQIMGFMKDGSTLNNVTIRNCHANYGGMLAYIDLNNAMDSASKGKLIYPLENLLIQGCSAQNFTTFGILASGVKHGVIEDTVVKYGRVMDYPHGLTAILIGATNHFYIRNCEIAYMSRYRDNPDGSGIDFERSNIDSHIENCFIHHNEGYAATFYYNNEDCSITNCTLLLNNLSSEFESEIHIFNTMTGNTQHNILAANNRYLVMPHIKNVADENDAGRAYGNQKMEFTDGDVLFYEDFEAQAVGDIPRAWKLEQQPGSIRLDDMIDISDKIVKMTKNASSGKLKMRKELPELNGVISASQSIYTESGEGHLPSLLNNNGEFIAGVYVKDGILYLETPTKKQSTNINIKNRWADVMLITDPIVGQAKLYLDDEIVASAPINSNEVVAKVENAVWGSGEAISYFDKIKLTYGTGQPETRKLEKIYALDVDSVDGYEGDYEISKENYELKHGIQITSNEPYNLTFPMVSGKVALKQKLLLNEASRGSIKLSNQYRQETIEVIIDKDGITLENDENTVLADSLGEYVDLELILDFDKQVISAFVDGKKVVESLPFDSRISGLDKVSYNGEYVLDDMYVRKLNYYKTEFYDQIDVGESPQDWSLENADPGNGAVMKKHEDGLDYLMFEKFKSTSKEASSVYKYKTTPMEGLVQYTLKVRAEERRFGRNIYLLNSDNKSVFCLNFSEGNICLYLGTTWTTICPYNANEWYDLSILADTKKRTIAVYLNEKLIAENIEFRNAPYDISVIQHHFGNQERGRFDFANLEIMNYEIVTEQTFENTENTVEFKDNFTRAVKALEQPVKKMFEPQEGLNLAQFTVMGEGKMSLLDTNGDSLININFSDNKVSYENNGKWIEIGDIDTSIFHDLRFVVDTQKRHYSLFLDRNILLAKEAINQGGSKLSGFGFDGSIALSNAKIVKYQPGEPIRIYDDFEQNMNNIWVE